MNIRRAYKYRIYPNKQQQQQLAVQFGQVRFIFNYGLDARKKAFKETGKGLSYTATALLLPKLKQDLPWLKEADSQVLQQTKKGSANRAKARRRVAILHEKIANQRSDFLHKLSNRLVRNHGTVRLEDLNVAGMVKCHSLAKSISDSGWNTFKLQCEYKACQYGAGVQSVDRFFPFSKTCNVCGYVNNDLKLQHRFWTCRECSAEHDRDVNAAINICNFNTVGATELKACGEDVRPANFLGGRLTSVKQEAQCL